MPAYCLFCETQKCATISTLIERCWGIRCISPQIIQRKWVKGIPKEVRHLMLPGYIFIYPDIPLEKLIWVPGIIRTLGNSQLQNRDLAFADMLKKCNGVVGTIHLSMEGDRFALEDPLWQHIGGKIVKIDRERKRCCIEFTFDDIQHFIWLGYDLAKK